MRFCTLFSGSSGNASFVEEGSTKILIDAGVSGQKIEKELLEIGEDIKNIQAIFITHEHQDHIMGVGVLSRRYGIPIYGNMATLKTISDMGLFKKLPQESIRAILNRETCVGDITVRLFNVSHDATAPSGYVVSKAGSDRKGVAVATDTGIVTDSIRDAVKGAETVLLEANHDVARLEFGPYPYPLKMRIKSELGHLSNDDAARFAVELAKSGTKNVILGHLSHENNIPELAFETVNAAFRMNGVTNVNLSVAPRFSHSKMIEV